MDTSMTPSQITDGQIEKFADQFRAALRKHRHEVSSAVAQQVLGTEKLGAELFRLVRKHAERISNEIVRRVKVNRSQTSKQALDATGRREYVDDRVVAAIPRGEGDEVEVVFFKPDSESYKDGWISCADVDKEYEKRGLKPDPRALAKANEDDPTLADTHPNACQWKDKDGNWCYAAFNRWLDERYVLVHRNDDGWGGGWFFAGVRK